MHVLANAPSANISILLTAMLSEAVAVIVTVVAGPMPEIGECVTVTLGGIVSATVKEFDPVAGLRPVLPDVSEAVA